MKLGMVVYSSDPETVWNAFRLGNFSRRQGDSVSVFLLGGGVEAESLDTAAFPVTAQMRAFVDAGGTILACGTCLELRHSDGTELCPVSTMRELHEMILDSDKVVSF